ncbi:TetR family transcriptional regulator C-terminal domain-containing protein [Streptomyces spiramenti]|uniref:TetR family transcriptional regulator n=1 Tax=Streptomyces spiramenti TaxID=2720606 RepID=A0ABX1AJZ5_9ACTN|nr:TetR family transcriptional regulator [Streptomyces spiramenti]
MPRVVDHDERRRSIARGYQRVLAEEGLARTSFVRVAEAAGISVGLIQHYFAGRDALLRFAYQDCVAAVEGRVSDRIRRGEAARLPISELLLGALGELLPLDPERGVEYRVRQHLLTTALTDQELSAVARAADARLLARVATAVENGKECGEVAADHDAGPSARAILAVTDGLAAAIALREPLRRGEGRRVSGGVLAEGEGDRDPHSASGVGVEGAAGVGHLPALDPADVLRPVLALAFTGRCRRHDPAPGP